MPLNAKGKLYIVERMKRRKSDHSIPEKTSRILNGILIVLFVVCLRLWHLSIYCHKDKLEEARRPQRRTVIEKAERATISDRFGSAVATNRVQYQAGIRYNPIRRIPRVKWKREEGRKVKSYARKEYIEELSTTLAEILMLDSGRIEDLIYSKAAILGNAPYILKENISEETYFRLKMLEKDWPGVHTEVAAKRCYPAGPVAGEIIGHIGPISRIEYDRAMEEIKELRLRQEEEGIDLSHEIEKKSFTFNDLTGKMGVEASFDANLRGTAGKRIYLADTRGRYIRELDTSEPATPGTGLTLSISLELQEYAEELLARYNSEPPSQSNARVQRRKLIPPNRPWLKEGAIVIMDPNDGQLLALASFPRFDPNDFIRSGDAELEQKRQRRINRWIESDHYLGGIWDRKSPIEREKFDCVKGEFYEETIEMGWPEYLSFILPEKSPVYQVITKRNTLKDAILIQKKLDSLLDLFEGENSALSAAQIFDFIYHEEDVSTGVMVTLDERQWMSLRSAFFAEEIEALKEELSPYFDTIPLNEEKLLLVDLYRLCINPNDFDPLLEELFSNQTLHEFREISGRMAVIRSVVCEIVKEVFKDQEFKQWREAHFKKYLAGKRKEERAKKMRYARPFLDYLDEMEKQLFTQFWNDHAFELIAQFLTESAESNSPYAICLQNWRKELIAGAHPALPWREDYCRLKELVEQLDSSILISYFKTLRTFNDLNRPLYGNYPGLRKESGGRLEKHLAIGFYPRYGYGYCRSHAFRQATIMGSLFKLIPAYEALRQNYFKVGADADLNPLTIVDDKYRIAKKGWFVGKTSEGKAIPLYYRGGRLPKSEHAGIGRVGLVRALETSSNPYFALLAGEVCEDPEDLCQASSLFGFGEKTGIDLPGEYAGKIPQDVAYNRTGLYSMAIGQHTLLVTPLQVATMLGAIANGGKVLKPQLICNKKPEVKWNLFMPKEIQKMLIEGMRAVVMGEKGTARFVRSQFPSSLVSRMIGKTSTSELTERYGLDLTSRALKSKEIWFGSIIYDKEEKPELVIVIYLKDGEFGRHAVPLAAKMAQKWHEICVKK
ncbi:MAG: Peptidoglycan D,D-transpeptidase MrdA [Chlamydiales bacterium]|nr:Peptidoglycan D,D-transpeptidase MrdA [Chlamydiales bacterium]MCH9619684.1 Peptidoglycan D,D-transpeptidase MrdA [Chlamydiales bacterium]MCH9623290.1 Peptidoglycan D,D-transpeptidase MrdA [Chlamydiales bacterium]